MKISKKEWYENPENKYRFCHECGNNLDDTKLYWVKIGNTEKLMCAKCACKELEKQKIIFGNFATN